MLILSNLQNIEISIKDIFTIISFKHNFYDLLWETKSFKYTIPRYKYIILILYMHTLFIYDIL